jgi:P-type conjugative transfer protein TrbJ
MTVYDPANFSQNVLTAARTLQQINNQIAMLNNQAQMLSNQTKMIAGLPFSSVAAITSQIQRTEQLIAQAQGIAYSINNINQVFTASYNANAINSNFNLNQQPNLVQAQQRWQNSMNALQDALRMQATVVGNIQTSRNTVTTLGAASQSATGALQASQVTNQLLIQISQQLHDLNGMMASYQRGQTLVAAGRLADKQQAASQYSAIIDRLPYTPQPVQMFH